jgi:peptidoglycan/LPS O-acetylase OafA/YrhL
MTLPGFANQTTMIRQQWPNDLRGIAALSVVFAHLVQTFILNNQVAIDLGRSNQNLLISKENYSDLVLAIASTPFSFAAFGVSLFFCISGFVIRNSIINYSRLGFTVSRFFRLVPTYAAGYAITLATISFQQDPSNELSTSAWLLGSIPGLGTMLSLEVPADGIVWTLVVEIVFYSAVIVGASLIRRTSLFPIILVAFSVCLYSLLNAAPNFLDIVNLRFVLLISISFFPLFAFGMILSQYYHERSCHLRRSLECLTSLVAFVYLCMKNTILGLDERYVISAVSAALVFMIVSFWEPETKSKSLNFFSDVSYPLYVVHAVFGYALITFLIARGLAPSIAISLTILLTSVISFIVHKLIEKPSQEIGRHLARRLTKTPVKLHA